MNENKSHHSFLLGDFVGMIQTMEEAVPGAQAKGDQWGQHLLPLFIANMGSSIQLACRIITNLQGSVEVNGKTLTMEQLKEKMEELDIEILENGIDEEKYTEGYHLWYGEKQVVTPESEKMETVQASPSNGLDNLNEVTKSKEESKVPTAPTSPSYSLGVFMANLQGLEEEILDQGGDLAGHKIEDLLLLLETNFDSTMQIVDKVLVMLPETIVFKGHETSIEQLKKSRTLLNTEKLSSLTLDQQKFKAGYNYQRSEYFSLVN